MKKILFAACMTTLSLGLASCSEDFSFGTHDGEVNVAYTVQTSPVVPQTRAAHDLDGKGAKVTRYICEVYHKDGDTQTLYKRVVNEVSEGTHQTTFNLRLVASQDYEVLFWADAAATGGADLYYNTPSLKDVSIKTDNNNDQYRGNNDAMDAFYGTHSIVNLTGTLNQNVTLTRPFAQLNVITTDIDDIRSSAMANTMEPDHVTLKVNAPTHFNVFTGEASVAADIQYTAGVYYTISGQNTQTTQPGGATPEPYTYCTLAMNYLFAPQSESAVEEVSLTAINSGEDLTAPVFSNIPLQRNYRTNIIGDLLTDGVNYNVTIEPGFVGDYNINVQAVSSVANANQALASGYTDIVISSPNDVATQPVEFPAATDAQAVSLTLNGTLDAQTPLLIGLAAGTQGPATLNIVTEDGTTPNLVINLPNTHVTLNGAEYENVTATTSASTLVVAENTKVKTLNVLQGGLEIFGQVTNLTITPATEGAVEVKTCKGLSAAQKDYVTPYLAAGYEAVEENGKWNIVQVPVAQVGTKTYATIADACAAVTASQPLTLLKATAWAEATPAYYAGNFYASLSAAIEAANTANANEAAMIYCRPGATFNEAAHTNLKTSMTIFGNNAVVNSGWEPTAEYAGAAYHVLTKDVNIAIYNLGGAGYWGTRQSNYTINFTMENCQNAHEVYVSDGFGTGLNNFTIKNCTFDGNHGAAMTAVKSNNPGTVTIENCTFANIACPVNNSNKGTALLTVDVKGCTFTNCAATGLSGYDATYCAPVRITGEKESSLGKLTVSNTTFTGTGADTAGDIVVGEGRAAKQGQGLVSYEVKTTAGKLAVYAIHPKDEQPSKKVFVLTANDTNVGKNLSEYYQDANGDYHIAGITGLTMFRDNRKNDHAKYYGHKIILDADIDLGGIEWEPIYGEVSGDWTITFDGNHHSIKNFKITTIGKDGAFFTQLAGEVKNLTLENVTISGTGNDQKRYAALVSYAGAVTIDNVHVKNVTISSNGYKVGAIAGSCQAGTVIQNCIAENVQISGTKMLGGIIGSAGVNDGQYLKFYGNRVGNLTITCSDETKKVAKSYGAFVGSYYNAGYEPQTDASKENTTFGEIHVYDANPGLGILLAQ